MVFGWPKFCHRPTVDDVHLPSIRKRYPGKKTVIVAKAGGDAEILEVGLFNRMQGKTVYEACVLSRGPNLQNIVRFIVILL